MSVTDQELLLRAIIGSPAELFNKLILADFL